MRDYRFRPKKRNPLQSIKLLVVVLLPIVLLGGVFLWLRQSDLLKVKDIEVEGAETISEIALVSEIKNLTVENYWLANLLGKESILAWGEIPAPLYDKFAQLSQVKISKDLLNRKVILEVQEKEKMAAWCLVKDELCFWIDGRGEVFSEAPLVQGRLVKVIRDYTPGRTLKLGDKVLQASEVTNLNKIFALLDRFKFSTQEIKLEDLKFKEISAFLDKGPEIKLALNIDPSFAIPVIQELFNSPEWSKIRYLDLRIENRLYYSK